MSADNLIAVAKVDGEWYVAMMFESSLVDMSAEQIRSEMRTGDSFFSGKEAFDFAEDWEDNETYVEYGVRDVTPQEPQYLDLIGIRYGTIG